jgi:hypothetical protein
MRVSWRKTVPPSRNLVSRSPYQSKSPEMKKSVANAAVRIAFTFCPALKRLGNVRGSGQEAAVVVVEEVDLADRLRDRPAVAE